MRVLFVADGRSPIALNWISHFVARGYQVHLVSLYPCRLEMELASLSVIPVAFSRAVAPARVSHDRAAASKRSSTTSTLARLAPPRLRTFLRHWFVPLSLPGAAENLRLLIERVRPDLIHAMRIPYEGMLAALAKPPVPLLVSVWGNDFTLHAGSTPWMRRYTRQTMLQASALHTDCQRDARLAQDWGFDANRPAAVLPGGGGVQKETFYPISIEEQEAGGLTIINPRGMRAYVRNDTFFKAIPRVLERFPQARFLCPSMARENEAKHWVKELQLEKAVELLPYLTRTKMADEFRKAEVAVSITEHDGTPNTLLEALACGCFPVAGDIETLREWITPGENGLLVDPGDPRALAEAIITALDRTDLRARAREINFRLVAERAEYQGVMAKAEALYRQLVQAPGIR
jgi:glycosyltransferase involved in cell wall biosynthesis